MPETLEKIKRTRIEYIDLLFTSITGRTHVLTVPADIIEDVMENGIGFDGSSVGFVGVEESDLFLKPVPDTFRVVPWAEKPTGVMIAQVCREDKPFELDPRNILKKVVARAKRVLGDNVEYMTAPEIEFWLFEKSDDTVRFHDDASYFYPPPADKGYEIRKEIAGALKKLGIQPVKLHHEVPPSKHEIDFQHSDAVTTADNTILYRYTVKNIAARHGLVASFMPKPFYGTYGAGMHTHQSLYDTAKGVNLFHGDEVYGLSKTALYFIGGLLRYAKAITVATNPTVNSYKRLVPGWEAPVYVTWARYNRSALIRIPMAATPKQKRLEYRATDGSVNPYLAFSAMLAAGLKGIEEKIEPPEPVEENVYHMSEEERRRRGIEVLPSSLKEAIEEARRVRLLEEAWGREAFEKYITLKEREWFEYSVMVHEWERKRYLELW
ncbi:MAG: glutamine synthetase beta-grasp domain-containing protein [Pyrodictiaceae archaeon]